MSSCRRPWRGLCKCLNSSFLFCLLWVFIFIHGGCSQLMQKRNKSYTLDYFSSCLDLSGYLCLPRGIKQTNERAINRERLFTTTVLCSNVNNGSSLFTNNEYMELRIIRCKPAAEMYVILIWNIHVWEGMKDLLLSMCHKINIRILGEKNEQSQHWKIVIWINSYSYWNWRLKCGIVAVVKLWLQLVLQYQLTFSWRFDLSKFCR